MKSALLLALAFTVYGQTSQPNVANAQLETRPYSGHLEQQIRADRPTWFGYAMKSVSKNTQSCCCSLEGNTRSYVTTTSPVLLEGSDTIAILYRVSNNSIEKIQLYSLSCPLDAGGLPFVWLTGVPLDASLSFLQKLDGQHGAVFAISQHDGEHAIEILIAIAKQDPSSHLRGEALFWLAQRAGQRAAATITDAIQNDPDGEVKKKAVFALSQLPRDEGVPKLIEVARTQRNPEVRKQAFFWLGQSRDPRALAFIEDVLTGR